MTDKTVLISIFYLLLAYTIIQG